MHFYVKRGFITYNGQEHLIRKTEKTDENIPTRLFLSTLFKQSKKVVDIIKLVTFKMFARNVAAKFSTCKKKRKSMKIFNCH
jgi:hypothetical protein